MSKAGFLTRYGTIYETVSRNSHCSYDHLIQILEERSETLQDRDYKARMAISQRTIQRDLKEMEAVFGIKVVYDRKRKTLVLKETPFALLTNFHQLIESNALTNALVEGSRYAPHLKLSGKPDRGLQSLPEYLEAMEKRKCLRILYAPFDGPKMERTIEPYQIREYDGRWYLVGLDTNPESNHTKSFALDRIEEYKVLEKTFEITALPALDEQFTPCMGITRSHEPVLDVVLAFSNEEAPYIRSLPLHASQQILEDNGDSLVVKLCVYDTWELRAKIRSFGSHVEVLAPEWLRQGIREEMESTLKKYRKNTG